MRLDTSPNHRLGLAMPGGWQVSSNHGSPPRRGAAFFFNQLARSGRPPKAAGAPQVIPAAHVRHHAEELLRSVNASVPLRANSTAPIKVGRVVQLLLA